MIVTFVSPAVIWPGLTEVMSGGANVGPPVPNENESTANMLPGVGWSVDGPFGPDTITMCGPGIAPAATLTVVVTCVPSVFTVNAPAVTAVSTCGPPGRGTRNTRSAVPVNFAPLIVNGLIVSPRSAPPGLIDVTTGTEPVTALVTTLKILSGSGKISLTPVGVCTTTRCGPSNAPISMATVAVTAVPLAVIPVTTMCGSGPGGPPNGPGAKNRIVSAPSRFVPPIPNDVIVWPTRPWESLMEVMSGNVPPPPPKKKNPPISIVLSGVGTSFDLSVGVFTTRIRGPGPASGPIVRVAVIWVSDPTVKFVTCVSGSVAGPNGPNWNTSSAVAPVKFWPVTVNCRVSPGTKSHLLRFVIRGRWAGPVDDSTNTTAPNAL